MATNSQVINALYVLYRNGAPDKAGFDFWYNAVTTGGQTFYNISEGMYSHPTFQATYGSLSNQAFVEALYTNLLGGAGDAAGIAFWTAALDGGQSRSAMVTDFILATFSYTGTDADALNRQAFLTNKVTVAENWLVLVGDATNPSTTNPDLLPLDPAYQASIKIISGVTSDAGTRDSAVNFLTQHTDGTPVGENPIADINSASSEAIFGGGTTPGQTYTLTINPDAFTGSPNNDTFIASNDTLSAADVLNGSTGTDTLRYASSGNTANIVESGFQATSIETVQVTADVTGGFTTTFDVTGTPDVATLVNFNSSGDLIWNGMTKLVDIQLLQNSDGDTTVNYNASVTGGTETQNLTVNGNVDINNAATSKLTVNGIENFAITSTGSASKFTDIISNKLTGVTVTGDASLTTGNLNFMVNGTVDASGLTGTAAINTTIQNSNVIDVTVTGAAGNDTANFGAGFDAGDKFVGGTGTDTLVLNNNDAIALTVNGTFSDVEQLQVSTAGTGTIDMDNFAGFTKVIYDAGLGGATTVKDTGSDITVEVDVQGVAQNLTVAVKTPGAADVNSFVFDEIDKGDVIGTVTADNADTLNINVDDDTALLEGTLTMTKLSAADAETINITGDGDLTILDAATPLVGTATLDASTFTGNLNITNLDTASTGSTIKLGSGNDTIAFDAANGGKGIDTITLGAGSDIVKYTAVNQSQGVNVDVITDFTPGTDRLNFDGLGIAITYTGEANGYLAVQSALNGTIGQTLLDTTTSLLYVDVNGDKNIDNNDMVVHLQGVTDLSASDLGAGTGNTFTAKNTPFNTATAADSNEGTITTNQDDTINATYAQLNNAATVVNGLFGNDTLNVTDAVTGFLNVATYTSIEVLNLQQGTTAASTIFAMANLKVNNTSSNAATVTLAASAGQTYTGNSAIDTVTTGNDKQSISTMAGNDIINVGHGSAGNVVTVDGGLGDDTINFTAGTHMSIAGGEGNDTVAGGTFVITTTTIAGGAGTDRLNITADNAATDLDNVTGFENIVDTEAGAGTYTITAGSAFANDTTTVAFDGSAMGGILTFNATTLTRGISITGGLSADVLTGGSGNDTIVGGGGAVADNLTGNGGNDTFTVASTGAVTVAGGTGNDIVTLTGATGNLTITGVESVTGSGGIDVITVNDAILASITGGAGNDVITLTVGTGTARVVGFVTAGDSFNVDTIAADANVDILATAGADTVGITANDLVRVAGTYADAAALDSFVATVATGASNVAGYVVANVNGVTTLYRDANFDVAGGLTLIAQLEGVAYNGIAFGDIT